MSQRLTPEQLNMLDTLVDITWNGLENGGPVYIRQKDDSIYGPYKVIDVEERQVSRLDGSMPRRYPRDKGLLMASSTYHYTKQRTYDFGSWNNDSAGYWEPVILDEQPRTSGTKAVNMLVVSIIEKMLKDIATRTEELQREVRELEIKNNVLVTILEKTKEKISV